MKDEKSKSSVVSVDVEERNVNSCPECNHKLYFLEAGFLCPVCGYSIETLYID